MSGSIIRTFQGNAQAFQNSLSTAPVLICVALIVVYIILGILYESFIDPLTIFSTLPSAGVGALGHLSSNEAITFAREELRHVEATWAALLCSRNRQIVAIPGLVRHRRCSLGPAIVPIVESIFPSCEGGRWPCGGGIVSGEPPAADLPCKAAALQFNQCKSAWAAVSTATGRVPEFASNHDSGG
jgi:hypothetical protein